MAKPFHFQKFSIQQEHAAMKLGSDAVLFGCWIKSAGKRFIDVGSGTGILSLILAQKHPEPRIDALEIDHEALKDAQVNFQNSPFSERLKIKQGDFRELKPELAYDALISNPPFFEGSLKGPTEARNQARHNNSLSWKDILNKADLWVKPQGSIFLLLPAGELEHLKSYGSQWKASRICNFHPLPDRDAHRIFVEFQRSTKDLVEECLIYKDEKGKLSDEAQKLTKGFYIK